MLTRRHSTVVLVAALVVALGLPAQALVAPQMSVTASHTSTTITVCGDGQLRGATPPDATWRMVSLSTGGIPEVWQAGGSTFHHCYTGPLTADSIVSGVLAYTGSGDDYPSTLFGYGTYINGRYDEFEMSQ